jgi:NADPH:quinone reductase-like Zn-dependent oxidoreductase
MKAAQINNYGGPDLIVVRRDAPRPTPAKTQLLVEVRAASLNPIDTIIRTGGMQQKHPLQFPATLGGDFAGVVVEFGQQVRRLAAGDGVYGQASKLMNGSGTLAEYTVVDQDKTALKPKSIDFTAAASLPLVGTSAVQAITEYLNVRPGQRILIHGAAGGIGSVAVQLAKHLGAYVIGTAFSDDIEYVTKLGANEVIDVQAQQFDKVVRDVDGVLDTVGGETNAKSYGVIKRGGVLVSMTVQPDQARMSETGVKAIAQFTQPTTERLTKLAELVDAGAIKPNIDRVFTLDQAAAAFKYRETNKPRGKVMIVPKQAA